MKEFLFFCILVLSFSFRKEPDIQPKENSTCLEPESICEIIKHTYYTLAYSEDDEQAYWVFYHLTPELICGTQNR